MKVEYLGNQELLQLKKTAFLASAIKEHFCDAVFRFMRHPYLVLSSHKTVIDNSIV